MKITVYLYKEYNDNEAYGTEFTQLFPCLEEAKNKLRERVEEHYGRTMEELRADLEFLLDDQDTLEDTYVSVNTGGGTDFFIIDEHEIDLPAAMQETIAKKYDRENKRLDIKSRYDKNTKFCVIDTNGITKDITLGTFNRHERRQILSEVAGRLGDALAVDDVYSDAYWTVMNAVLENVVEKHYSNKEKNIRTVLICEDD